MPTAPARARPSRPPLTIDGGSFRDPSGGVVLDGRERVFRFFRDKAAAEFGTLMQSGLLEKLESSGAVVGTRIADEADEAAVRRVVPDARLVVEHPRIPFISYACEWSFEMLKAAALSHLDSMSEGLRRGFMLKDATPFNIQFSGPKPVLIDVASFERHEDGAAWAGYTQFCRNFLNPLLLQSVRGMPFQGWLRSSLDGIDPAELSRLLPFRHKMRPSVFTHVVLQAWLNRRLTPQPGESSPGARRKIPTDAILRMADGLRGNIERMQRRKDDRWNWADYEKALPYTAEALATKELFIEESVAAAAPEVLWDLGCNTGRFTLLAAKSAKYVVAFDFEEAAVGSLYERVRDSHANVLPLVMDLTNPTPDHGWNQEERKGLRARGPADFAMALALVHHLRISGNVPVSRIAGWLAGISKAGVVEFVPKSDAMVQTLLRTRPDVYGDYTRESFEAELECHFDITETAELPGSERILYRYAARGG